MFGALSNMFYFTITQLFPLSNRALLSGSASLGTGNILDTYTIAGASLRELHSVKAAVCNGSNKQRHTHIREKTPVQTYCLSMHACTHACVCVCQSDPAVEYMPGFDVCTRC